MDTRPDCSGGFLEKFVDTSVFAVLSVLQDAQRGGRSKLAYDEFYQEVQEIVCRNLSIQEEVFLSLHHAVHWDFFCTNGSSLLGIDYPKDESNQGNSIPCIYYKGDRPVSELNKNEIAGRIIQKYRSYLNARLASIRESA